MAYLICLASLSHNSLSAGCILSYVQKIFTWCVIAYAGTIVAIAASITEGIKFT